MKIAVCIRPDVADNGAIARKMAQMQRARAWHTCELATFDGGAMACVHTSDRHLDVDMFRRSERGNILMVSGLPIDPDGRLEQRLQRVCDGDAECAQKLLPELDGAFTAVFWDAAARKLVIVNDCLGMQPLCVHRRDGLVLLATEAKGIAASGLTDVQMDPLGWGALISLGEHIDTVTSLADVRKSPPASIIVYDAATDRWDRREYWPWPSVRTDLTLDDIDTHAIVDMLRFQVQQYLQYVSPGTILLSGGFDSRLILELVLEAGARPNIVTLSNPYNHLDADGRYGRRIAKRHGLDVRMIHPKRFFSSTDYLDYVLATDVSTQSYDLFVTQLSRYIRPEWRAAWEGVGLGCSINAPGRGPARQLGGYEAYWRHNGFEWGSPTWQAAERVFGIRRARDMYDQCRQRQRQLRDAYGHTENGVTRFHIRSRTANRTGQNPLVAYANDVLPLTPGIGKAYCTATGEIPEEIKWQGKLYFRIYERHFPKAMHVPIFSQRPIRPGPTPFAKGLWLRLSELASYGLRYARASRQRIGAMLPAALNRSDLISSVIAHIPADHPDLNSDGVEAVRKGRLRFRPAGRPARLLLFYWQMWRWVMEGRISSLNMDVLADRPGSEDNSGISGSP